MFGIVPLVIKLVYDAPRLMDFATLIYVSFSVKSLVEFLHNFGLMV